MDGRHWEPRAKQSRAADAGPWIATFASDDPFVGFAAEPGGSDRSAVGRVVRDDVVLGAGGCRLGHRRYR